MLSRKRSVYKVVASFLLINFVATTLWPTISYALTSGPTAPEFTSFEPVDTTDMVNLQTGDFVYNTPLLEVPGPGGGYPVSLNYHGGVSPEAEASWIGLNWNLNVGCINRTVDAYPDDSHLALRKVKDYWGGGGTTTETYGVGLTIPFTGVSLTYEETAANDTYKGQSHSRSLSADFDLVSATNPGPNAALAGNIGAAAAVLPSIYYSKAKSNLFNYRAGWSISSNTKGVKSHDKAEGDLRQNKNIRSSSYQTISTVTSSQADYAQIQLLSFNTRKNYVRYYVDQTSGLYSFGSLYGKAANLFMDKDFTGSSRYESYGYDAYSLYDYTSLDPKDDNDPEKQLGGSFPAFDSYEVLGQGIGGIMKPYIFENGNLQKQNIYDKLQINYVDKKNAVVSYKSIQNFSKNKVNFRFVGDFSNSLSLKDRVEPIHYNDDGTGFHVSPHQPLVNSDGYNPNNQHLAGSKHVDWFTNSEMKNGVAKKGGLMLYHSADYAIKTSFELTEDYLQPEMALPTWCKPGGPFFGNGAGSYIKDTYKASTPFDGGVCPYPDYDKSFKPKMVDMTQKIGGFKVTNASGVTYHYSIPVYTYNEYTRMKVKNPRKGVPEFKEYKNDEPYAYTWLLTGVTGPDFVDANLNGIIDDADQGYWVKFEYGKWTDSYQWRSPLSGYRTDIEDNYETFSYGIKELYYLDAIETSTHKAIFIKSIRKDAKGVTSRLEGGIKPRKYTLKYQAYKDPAPPVGTLDYNISPVSTLKLDGVYLFNKKDLEGLNFAKTVGEKYMEAPISAPYLYEYKGGMFNVSTYSEIPPTQLDILYPGDVLKVKYHNGDLVYDDGDLSNETFKSQFVSKALKVIHFDNNHYDLCKGTPNSYEKHSPVKLSYEGCLDFGWTEQGMQEGFYSKEFYGGLIINSYLCDGTSFDYRPYSGKLTLKAIKILGKGGADILPETRFNYSSYNPNYSNQYDTWKYHKSDYKNQYPDETRRPTSASSEGIEAWSMTSIETGLGSTININYDADCYSRSEMSPYSTFSISHIYQGAPNICKIHIKEAGLNMEPYFNINEHVKIHAIIVYKKSDGSVGYTLFDNGFGDAKCIKRGEHVIEVENSYLYNSLGSGKYLIGGLVKANAQPVHIGGGLRVASIELRDNLTDEFYKTRYHYENPVTGLSSGITSYEPYSLPTIKLPEDIDIFDRYSDKYRKDEVKLVTLKFMWMMNNAYGKAMALSREIPGPNVMYEYVKVDNSSNGVISPQSVQYEFQVFNENMVKRNISNEMNYSAYFKSRIVTIQNFTSLIGNLKSVKVYDKGNIVSETVNNYLNDELIDVNFESTNQGVVHQAFNEYRKIRKEDDTFIHKALVSVREEYPSAALSSITKDHKKGIIARSENRQFDYYTGMPTKVASYDAAGNTFLTIVTPAYQIPKSPTEKMYPDFGLKVNIPSNKHMLSQDGETKIVTVDENNNISGIVSSSVQTWEATGPYREFGNGRYSTAPEADPDRKAWKNKSKFSWLPNTITHTGLGRKEEYTPFNWSTSAQEQGNWKRVENITLYDVYSHPLESTDINGNYSSVKMGYNNSLVIATATNSKYTEMAYSGAEDDIVNNNYYFGGEVLKSTGVVSNVSHTGSHGISVAKGGTTFIYNAESSDLSPSKYYRASVWVKGAGSNPPQGSLYYKINGTTVAEKSINVQLKAGDWYLINLDIPPVGNFITFEVGCKNNVLDNSVVYFDDFRFHPIKSSFASYVYDPSTWELKYILDGNNLFTNYNYDAAGRLTNVYRETFTSGPILLKSQQYHHNNNPWMQ